MKKNIYSEDIYLKEAIGELVMTTSISDMSCTGRIAIIDLLTLDELSITGLGKLNFCCMILLSETPCIQEWLIGKNVISEIHVISRNATVKDFQKQLSEIFTKSCMRKCLLAGVRCIKETIRPSTRYISPREKEVLELYLKKFSIKDIATKIGINTKTVCGHKNAAMKKMKLSGNIFLLTRTLQQILILERVINLQNECLVRKPSLTQKCNMIMIKDIEVFINPPCAVG